MNGEDKTFDPFFEIPLNKLLNVTVKYNDATDLYIPEANVILTGEGVLETLTENATLNQYSIIFNTTIKLNLGVNPLTILAQKLDFEQQITNPRITVRKINTEIKSISGNNTISITPGEDASIEVYVNNTDFDRLLKGLVVTYSWDGDSGLFTDLDDNGIYNLTLKNIPAGTHTITINAFGGDIYNFASYEFTITAVKQGQNALLFQILAILGAIAAVTIGGYLYAYQKVLKFPKTVRKVRKYRKNLNKKSQPHVDIKKREKAFNSAYKEELGKSSRHLRGKPKVEQKEVSKSVTPKSKQLPSRNRDSLNSNQKYQFVDKYQDKKPSRIKGLISPFKNGFKNRLRKFWNSSNNLKNKFKFFYPILILLVLILYMFIINPFFILNVKNPSGNTIEPLNFEDINKLGNAGQKSFTTQWFANPTLDGIIEPTWYSELEGDLTDITKGSGSNHANISVIGDTGIINIDTPLNNGEWDPVNNPEFPISPDSNGSDSTGLFISHEWDEGVDQSRNSPSIHWKNNISLPVNMSDFVITSASLEVVFNASVTAFGAGQPHINGIERPGDYTEGLNPPADTQFGIGDFVTFYALFSDIDNTNSFQVAVNRTTDLGQDSPEVWNYTDSFMTVVPEEILITYLTSVLEDDEVNFTITLGIDIYCEDNEWNVDIDTWDLLTIRSFNLTFTYEKKINQFSSGSWNQDAGKISALSPNPVIVDEALLNFKYKTDKNWTNTSPNSEIRILINDNLHKETVKLSTANTTLQEGKSGGFDITSLIIDEVNFSIQVFLADEFGLSENITIIFDDIYLNISYTIIFPDIETDLRLFLNDENKTDDPSFSLNVGIQLNITIKYLNKTGDHIPNATVLLSGNFTGALIENAALKQYSIIIDTEISNIGVNFLTITANTKDYEQQKITPIITINKINSKNIHIFLNTVNMTLDPNVELVIGEELNITIIYRDNLGSHIPNATVQLISLGVTRSLNESKIFNHYSVVINTSDRLRIGVNQLIISAQSLTFETQNATIGVLIRKINIDIQTVSGDIIIQKDVGSDLTIRIKLNNTDFGGFVKATIVTFVSNLENGILTDSDNDSIYEATIAKLPEGVFTFTISAIVGDDYYVEDVEITVIASKETEDPILFQTLFVLSIILVSALAIYLYAYQKILKYPKPVRKVRKYRKTLNRKNDPEVIIVDREKSFRNAFKHETTVGLKIAKQTQPKKFVPQKMQPKILETRMETEQLIEKSLEKKEELDDLVEKFKKD
ncbi:MAG: hypothetical protein ACW99E_10080 [Promethearchaeota archaeon]